MDLQVPEGWSEEGEDLRHGDPVDAELTAYCDDRSRYEENGFTGPWELDAVSRMTGGNIYDVPNLETTDVDIDAHPARVLSYMLEDDGGTQWVSTRTLIGDLYATVQVQVDPRRSTRPWRTRSSRC